MSGIQIHPSYSTEVPTTELLPGQKLAGSKLASLARYVPLGGVVSYTNYAYWYDPDLLINMVSSRYIRTSDDVVTAEGIRGWQKIQKG